MKSIPNGTYRHYKGNLYEVLGTARHSETQEWHVIYKTCYGDFSTWIRPLSMFIETVEINGKIIPRFEHIENKTTIRHTNTFVQKEHIDDNSDVLNALNDSLK
ncbi:MAG: DUF1653 domain-containing protein [Gammaproteobacteria bacterium]|nr:DUF1653 domain-containing protein [Gammaproteobacteria bacterium]